MCRRGDIWDESFEGGGVPEDRVGEKREKK